MDLKATFSKEELFGLFELDDAGVVRYSRPVFSVRQNDGEDPLIGQNFFEHALFGNIDDLHRHFKRFVYSHRGAESFTLDCLFETETIKAKVLMTRAFETELFPASNVVMLDIRKNAV